MRNTVDDKSFANEFIPLLHLAGELNEAAKHDEKAVYFYEEECRISQLLQQPAQLSCHVRLSNLYLKMGKIEEAKRSKFG